MRWRSPEGIFVWWWLLQGRAVGLARLDHRTVEELADDRRRDFNGWTPWPKQERSLGKTCFIPQKLLKRRWMIITSTLEAPYQCVPRNKNLDINYILSCPWGNPSISAAPLPFSRCLRWYRITTQGGHVIKYVLHNLRQNIHPTRTTEFLKYIEGKCLQNALMAFSVKSTC